MGIPTPQPSPSQQATQVLPGLLSPTDKIKIDGALASWTPGTYGFFALDGVNGNDANSGFSTVDVPTAGANAVATLARLRQIIPVNGNGCKLMVVIRSLAGAAAYSGGSFNLVRALAGYSDIRIRATGPSPEGDVVAFQNTAKEKSLCGFQLAATGPNSDGSYTVATGIDPFNWTIAAGTLPTANSLRGARIRWGSSTTTSLLRDYTCMVYGHTSGTGATVTSNAIAPGTPIPAAGDVFFLETPACTFSAIELPVVSGGVNLAAGLRCDSSTLSSNVFGGGGFMRMSGCRLGAFSVTDVQTVSAILSYPAENDVQAQTGVGLWVTGPVSVKNATEIISSDSAFTSSSTAPIFENVRSFEIGDGGLIFGVLPKFRSCGMGAPHAGLADNVEDAMFGNRGTPRNSQSMLVLSANSFSGFWDSSMTLRRIVATNLGSFGMNFAGVGCTYVVDEVSGSTGNTGPGLDLSGLYQSQVLLGSQGANSITGTTGDVLLAGSAVASHATFTTTNVRDSRGNNILGTGGEVVGPCLPVSNQSGGALAVGDLVRSNGTSGQVTKAQGDTSAHASGPLLAMVTPPASAAAGYACQLAQLPWIRFDGTPTVAATAFVSTGTAGQGTSTVPVQAATNQRRRLGQVFQVSGTLARVIGPVDLVPVTADGTSGDLDMASGTVTALVMDPAVAGTSGTTTPGGGHISAAGSYYTLTSALSPVGWRDVGDLVYVTGTLAGLMVVECSNSTDAEETAGTGRWTSYDAVGSMAVATDLTNRVVDTDKLVFQLGTGSTLTAARATAAALPACTAAGSGVGKTLTGNANGALTVDGGAPALNDLILVKDQVNQVDNGFYKYTTVGTGGVPFVLTRATTMDQTSEAVPGTGIAVTAGTANAGTTWILNGEPQTFGIGLDPFPFGRVRVRFDWSSGQGSIQDQRVLKK